jgi:Ca-activated chloride channel family protein
MRVKKFTLAALALVGSSILIAPSANASGFIVVDPAFHGTMVPAPVAPPVTPVTPLRPGDRAPRPSTPVLHGTVSTGLSLDKQEITVDIDNNVAKTYIKQTFRNDTDRDLAGTYLFPLPQDATFSSFSLHIDGKPIEGKILAAAEARTQYEQIVRSMVDPGLLEYADYKTVRARIFPIPKHGTKTVELEYTQLVKADGGMLKYRFPLKSAQCMAVDETKIDMKLKSKEELRTIWSPSHTIETTRKDNHSAIVSFNDKATDQLADKDFSIYYTVSDKDLSTSILSHKKADQDGYFLMTLNPPLSAKEVVSKDVVLVADTSGSMNGEKMDQCKKALKYVVESLHPKDRFSLVRFSTDAEVFQSKLIEATPENVGKAKEFIEELHARGGTNIGDALASGLEILNVSDSAARPAYMVLLTDGQPTVGTTGMTELIKSVKPKRDIRLFDFGVGYDVNTQLLNKLAEEHHGSAQYVEPDEDLEITLSHFYQKISSPVLSDVKIAYDGIEVKDVYPKSVKDLFAGTPVMLIGRYKTGASATVKLTGSVNGSAKSFNFPLSFAESEAGSSYLPRMWAMRRIGYLTEVAQANDDNQEVVDEIVELSKHYGIISAYTSFLVTDPNEATAFRSAAVTPAARTTFMRTAALDDRSFRSGRRLQMPSPLAGATSGTVPPPPAVTLSTAASSAQASFMPIPSGEGGSGADRAWAQSASPTLFAFSGKHKAAMGAATAPSPGAPERKNESAVRGRLVNKPMRSGLPASSMDSFVASGGGAAVDHIYGDEGKGLSSVARGDSLYSSEEADRERVKKSKDAFARAIASAQPAGEKAVMASKSVNALKSADMLARAGTADGVKVIGDKTFYFLNGFWVDSSFEKVKDPTLDEIEFGSTKYFELVKNESEITPFLGAGQQVIVVFKGRCYKIVAPAKNVG